MESSFINFKKGAERMVHYSGDWRGLEKGISNGTAHIRHQCRKTADLSCHRYLFNSGVEKMNTI
jgi:hypothetical protein